jgi:hypothetical protein
LENQGNKEKMNTFESISKTARVIFPETIANSSIEFFCQNAPKRLIPAFFG